MQRIVGTQRQDLEDQFEEPTESIEISVTPPKVIRSLIQLNTMSNLISQSGSAVVDLTPRSFSSSLTKSISSIFPNSKKMIQQPKEIDESLKNGTTFSSTTKSSTSSASSSSSYRKRTSSTSSTSSTNSSTSFTSSTNSSKASVPTLYAKKANTTVRKSPSSSSRRPNAENSGMSYGALEPYLRSIAKTDPNFGLSLKNTKNERRCAETVASAALDGKSDCVGAKNGKVDNEIEILDEVSDEELENFNGNGNGPLPQAAPDWLPAEFYNTPRKLSSGVSTCTIIPNVSRYSTAPPRLEAKGDIQRRLRELEFTPPHVADERIPSLDIVVRQLNFPSRSPSVSDDEEKFRRVKKITNSTMLLPPRRNSMKPILQNEYPNPQNKQLHTHDENFTNLIAQEERNFSPPTQKNAKIITARVCAYRKRMEKEDLKLKEIGIFFTDDEDEESNEVEIKFEKVSEEEDNTKENESFNSEGSRSDVEREQDELTRRRKYKAFTSKAQPITMRRDSNGSNSNGSSSSGSRNLCAGQKRKLEDCGLGGSLTKILKKRFADEVNWSKLSPHLEDADPRLLGFLLLRYFMKLDPTNKLHRPTHAEQVETLIFFTKGIESALESTKSPELRAKMVKTLLASFEIAHESSAIVEWMNCYWRVFIDLLTASSQSGNGRRGQARVKNEDSLALLEHVMRLMERTYEEYENSNVKVNYPLIVTLFQGLSTASFAEQRLHLKKNFQELLNLLFRYDESSKEFALLMGILNLAVKHYCRFENSIRFYYKESEMVSALSKAIAQNSRADFGLSVIQKIQAAEFGERLCRRILLDQLEELNAASHGFEDSQIEQLLTDLSFSSLVLERVAVEYEQGWKIEANNTKGESKFHRACARKSTHSKKAQQETDESYLKALLDDLLRPDSRYGDINATDNNGNTCLHDACQNGRYDAIALFVQYCWSPADEPSRTNLDILAQDCSGNSALHIALSSLKGSITGRDDNYMIRNKVEVVKLLVQMAEQSPKKKQILFELRNGIGESVFSFGVEDDTNSVEVMEFLKQNHEVEPFATASGIELSNYTQEKIKNSPPLQKIFAYWEYFRGK